MSEPRTDDTFTTNLRTTEWQKGYAAGLAARPSDETGAWERLREAAQEWAAAGDGLGNPLPLPEFEAAWQRKQNADAGLRAALDANPAPAGLDVTRLTKVESDGG